MNVTLSGPILLAVLGLVTIPLFLLISLLLILFLRSSQKEVKSLRLQNQDLWQLNQSLLNQLRAKDLPSLVSLQQLTVPSLNSEEPYVPSWDDGLQYQEAMEAAGNYVTEGLNDDLAAAGWEHVVRPASSGGPVRFNE